MDGNCEKELNLDLKRMNISAAAISSSKRLTATNPFEIDLIVEKVMDCLTYDALRTCFTVSWGWRKKAFLEMKSREGLRTVGPSIKELKKLYVEITSDRKSAKPLKLSKLNLDRLPLSTPLLRETLKLLSPYLDALMICTDVNLHELFATLQELPNLRELSILPDSFDLTKNEVSQPIYPIQDPIASRCINFENIRSFSFYSTQRGVLASNGPNVKRYLTLTLSGALKMFPNLVTLYVGNLAVEDHRNFNGISFEKLKQLRLSQKFELDIKAINKSLGMLAKLGLKLTRLQFQFTPLKGLDRDLFRKFVESQRDTLQHLDIVQIGFATGTADHTPNICPFPLNLPHLKTLHVQKPFIQKLTPIFNALPSLEEAKICVPKGFNWKDITTKVKKSYPNLQVLRVDYMHPSLFGIMSQYFPSIRVLQINMWDNVNQPVFSSMKTPAEDDSESGSNMYPCKICGSTSNATCGSCGQKRLSLGYPDYSVVDGDQITSKALDHWKEIDTLIGGNSGICFLEDKLTEHNKLYLPYLDADFEIETLGLNGMAHWAMWESNEFNYQSHYLRPFNWTFTTCMTVDGLYIPFDNNSHLKRDDAFRLFRNIFF